MNNYHNKNIVIIGLGITGISCINFFLSRGVIPRVIDTRLDPPEKEKLPNFIEYWLGSLNQQWLLDADLIIVSPGMLMHPLLIKYARTGIEIISDIELFCREARAPIIAITGTNGKSTVSVLIGEMARSCGLVTGVGGNIGLPALNLLQQSYQLYILELSSFQLEATYSLHTKAATILNLSEDHRDYYFNNFSNYKMAKLRIYEHAKVCIFNADEKNTQPKILNYHQKTVSFGIHQGDYHLNFSNGNIWILVNGAKILNTAELQLIGQHNYTNVLAALAMADVLGLSKNCYLQALKKFPGLPHRFQLVWKNKGIYWVNDSKATNVSSTIAALKVSKLLVRGIIYLLVGGDSKDANLKNLSFYLQDDQLKLYCYGRDRKKFAKLRQNTSILTTTMVDAMQDIASKVKPGDLVLLSPACSSKDQFKDFAHRGKIFTQFAKILG
ncbi:MAG: UDP-N-acetylmuramoyl-L-alanine--D-glutamate ligase [Candidatus Dasytiphilus stammeri]